MPPERRKMVIAATIAVTLLVAGGLAVRILAEHLGRTGDHVALPRGTLAQLPLNLGDWTGRESPLDEAIVKATSADDYLNRLYFRQPAGPTVGLYIAYGVRARDLMPHRPEVCYPGNGWTLDDTESRELPLAEGEKLPCRIYRFSRGTLDRQTITVLNYYIVDGQYAPDVSLLRSKAWQGSGAIQYMVQVQVTCSEQSAPDPDVSARAVDALATLSAKPIRSLLPDAAAEAGRSNDVPRSSVQSRTPTEKNE